MSNNDMMGRTVTSRKEFNSWVCFSCVNRQRKAPMGFAPAYLHLEEAHLVGQPLCARCFGIFMAEFKHLNPDIKFTTTLEI